MKYKMTQHIDICKYLLFVINKKYIDLISSDDPNF